MNPSDWTNPETQVLVGLSDLEQGARSIHGSYRDLFQAPGSDWDLRAAVLLRFAGGGGFVRTYLRKYRTELARLAENGRWESLNSKVIPKPHEAALFQNVNKKMVLASKLGYQPK